MAKNGREIDNNTRCMYICRSVELAMDSRDDSDVYRVHEIINDRLGNRVTLESWLAVNYGIECNTRQDFDKLQVTRHAWVDSMIAELEAKGD